MAPVEPIRDSVQLDPALWRGIWCLSEQTSTRELQPAQRLTHGSGPQPQPASPPTASNRSSKGPKE
jgi:hypothetical protein